jgi:RNA polymerase-binding transcription factor DksA
VDDIDRAQELEQLQRGIALDAARARITASFASRDAGVDETCIDCGNAIEPERMKALRSTSRCFECARALELHRP